ECREFVLTLDQTGASPFGFELVRLREHARIRAHDVTAAVDFATHERLAHEYRVRRGLVLLAELHDALLDEREPEQRHLLEREHRAAFARPVRFAPGFLHQMRRLLLDPLRLDARTEHSVYFLQI